MEMVGLIAASLSQARRGSRPFFALAFKSETTDDKIMNDDRSVWICSRHG
jgi:hypothetical protein